jgi:hypothetical protein
MAVTKHRIAFWCYKDDIVDTDIPIKEVGSTGNTLYIILNDGTKMYGVYPMLPRVSEEVKEEASKSCVDASVFKDCARTITIRQLQPHWLDDHLFTAILEHNEVVDVKPIGCIKPDIFGASITCATDNLTSLSHSIQNYATAVNALSNDMYVSGNLRVDGKVYINGEEIATTNNPEEKKGTNNMNNMFGNIRTGKAGSKYAITYFGGISFNGKTYHNGKIFEAQGMTFPCDMLYLVPATSVSKGDIIEKEGIAYHITAVDKSGSIDAINLGNGKEETIVPGGPFGMSLYSKLFNPFGNMKGDNAFGNMMLMQSMMGGSGDSGNAMMMAMLMSQGGFKLPSFELPNLDNQKVEK